MINKLREIRDLHGFSQTEVAEAVKVSRQTIHSIETGKFIPTTVLALKLANFFQVKVEDVFFLDEEDKREV